MPGWSMINGVWREMWGSSPNIDGVFRDTDIYANINGVARLIYSHELSEDDVTGFRLVYKRKDNPEHSHFPNLKFNPKLPVRVNLTGSNPGSMDLSEKGILFQYTNDDVGEEGLYMYEGHLYAVLYNDEIIDIMGSQDGVGTDGRVSTPFSTDGTAWQTAKITHMGINIDASLTYQTFGYWMFGWNSFFSTDHWLDPTVYPEKGPNKNTLRVNSYSILPADSRESTFAPTCQIGIARDMSSPTDNMIGSYGALDQSVGCIRLNGTPKPFVVEVYD